MVARNRSRNSEKEMKQDQEDICTISNHSNISNQYFVTQKKKRLLQSKMNMISDSSRRKEGKIIKS